MFLANLPNDTRVAGVVTVPRAALADAELAERMVHQRLRQQVADHLVRQRVERIERAESVDYRIDLLVLTPEQLARVVNQEAQRIALMLASPATRNRN